MEGGKEEEPVKVLAAQFLAVEKGYERWESKYKEEENSNDYSLDKLKPFNYKISHGKTSQQKVYYSFHLRYFWVHGSPVRCSKAKQ